MASPRTTPRAAPATSNGHAATPPADIRPPSRRVRVPELALGILVTVLFALGAVLWHLRAVDRSPALAVASELQRGAVIDAADVRVVYVSSDDPLARLEPSELDQVVGRVAAVDLAAGTLLTTSVLADADLVGEGDGVVGLSLDPGAYPARGLAPGDSVNVVLSTEAADPDAEPTVVAEHATVHGVEELASDRLLVSVLAKEADADAVASAAGGGALRLVLVAP